MIEEFLILIYEEIISVFSFFGIDDRYAGYCSILGALAGSYLELQKVRVKITSVLLGFFIGSSFALILSPTLYNQLILLELPIDLEQSIELKYGVYLLTGAFTCSIIKIVPEFLIRKFLK